MHVWGTLVDEATGRVFATKAGSSELLIADENAGAIRAIPTGAIPCAVAQNPVTGFIYVVNHGDDSVTAIGGVNLQPIATIKVGASPQGIAIDSKSNRIYVANVHDDSVTMIDGARNVAVKTFRVRKNPYALAVDETAAGCMSRSKVNHPSPPLIQQRLPTSTLLFAYRMSRRASAQLRRQQHDNVRISPGL